MPFIPHTSEDVAEMMSAIDIKELSELFSEIPESLLGANLETVSAGLAEMEMSRLIAERVPTLLPGSDFIGAGAYEHYIPALVLEIMSRGEFYSAYTPYQAEASQGTLQLIYEYQTMMAHLMSMEVSNASLYDGATALAESILMSVRLKKGKARKILVPKTIHPHYRQVLETIITRQGITIELLDFSQTEGTVTLETIEGAIDDTVAAVVIGQPNFFGRLSDVDAITDAAHAKGVYVIGLINPMAMALLKPPGEWGEKGADIACGEGQPLGVPLSGGGPYFGFMCCQKSTVRQLPGRIVGCAYDKEGRRGFTLTLQAREQHIRRAKATSNICTNQGLMVTAATVYMSAMGAKGLRNVAAASHHNAKDLMHRLTTVPGVNRLFSGPFFHEFVLHIDGPVEVVQKRLLEDGLQAGYSLKSHYPELGDSLLVCATETKTTQDLLRYQQLLEKAMT